MKNVSDNDLDEAMLENENQEVAKGLPVEIDIDPRMPGTLEKEGAAEDTIPILVDVEDPNKVLKIGEQLDEKTRERLTTFLKSNLDAFSRCHSDMVGIDPKVMCHHLNIDPERRGIHRREGLSVVKGLPPSRKR